MQPSLTLDDTNILKEIDGIEALKQSIERMLTTERFQHSIYDHRYGCEIGNLIGGDMDFAVIDAKRLIEECLYEDDRILEVSETNVKFEEDSIYVRCIIKSIFGDFEMEVDM